MRDKKGFSRNYDAIRLDESYTFISVPIDQELLKTLLNRSTQAGLYLSEYVKEIIHENEERERIKESLDTGNEE